MSASFSAGMGSRGFLLTFVAFFFLLVGCGGKVEGEDFSTTTQSVTDPNDPLTISGQVKSPQGTGVGGITVHLDGSSQAVQITGSDGSYSFPNLKPGSYSIRPVSSGCQFSPDVINLNNTVVNKAIAIIATCGDAGASGSADSGTNVPPAPDASFLGIFGRFADPNGVPIPGVLVQLNGSSQARQVTDVGGNYAFTNLAPGSYSVQPSLANCDIVRGIVDASSADSAAGIYRCDPGQRCCSTGGVPGYSCRPSSMCP